MVALLLVGLTVAAYWPVFDAGFVNYDDKDYVTENPQVLAGLTWTGLKWAFTTDLMGSWHPLTWLSHMADVQFFGADPAGHHGTSLFFHLLNVVLCFALFRALTGDFWCSALAAALFALHPLRVESVAWVAERKDVLSAFFGLLSLLAYVRYARPSPGFAFLRSPAYWLTGVFLALGLMSKPMLVTWPVVMLLLDVWPLRRISPPSSIFHLPSSKQLWLEKLPFIALVAGAAFLTWHTQQRSEAVMSLQDLSGPARLANVLHSLFNYLAQFVWPMGLAMFYPLQSWPVPTLVLAGLVVGGLSVLAFRLRRSQPWLAFGWCWYLIVLFPVCGLTQAGLQAHADRYTYLPSLGWSLALVWPLAAWLPCWLPSRPAQIALVLVPLLFFGVRTHQQVRVWRDSETLFRHALAVTAENFMAHQGLGEELVHAGKEAEAKEEFTTALDLYARLPSARNNLAVICLHEGRFAEAVAGFQQVLAERPDFVLAYVNQALAYEGLNDFSAAIPAYEAYLARHPDDFDAQMGLIRCLDQTGQATAALSRLRELQSHYPADPRVAALLAVQYQAAGQFAAAVAAYDTALALSPQSPDLYNNLAWLLAACGDASVRNGPRAVQLAERACQLTQSQQPFLLGTLAAAYAEAGRFEDAVITAQKAIDLAKAAGQTELATRNAELLERYRSHKPYHEPAR